MSALANTPMNSMEPFLQKRLVILNQYAPAHQAARAMSSAEVGCVLVGDAFGNLVGIVTDRDLATQPSIRADDGTELAISEVMMPDPITVDRGADLRAVIALMEEYGIRRIPVTELGRAGAKRCVGIVTMDDLIAAKVIDIDSLARIVKSQMARRSLLHRKPTRSWRQISRSEAHREQTLGRFYHAMAKGIGLHGETNVAEITHVMLASLVRRMQFSGATHLMGQLPVALRETLLELPAGPDRAITAGSVAKTLSDRFGYSATESEKVMRRFLWVLGEVIGSGTMEHLKSQLPEDMQRLFPELSSEGYDQAG